MSLCDKTIRGCSHRPEDPLNLEPIWIGSAHMQSEPEYRGMGLVQWFDAIVFCHKTGYKMNIASQIVEPGAHAQFL
jgi:hypothetical protein